MDRTQEQIDAAHNSLIEKMGDCWQTYVKRSVELAEVCDREGCDNRATHRIGLNVWGTISEYDLCKTHAFHSDGRSRDGDRCDGPW